jgi:hypothetical protein
MGGPEIHVLVEMLVLLLLGLGIFAGWLWYVQRLARQRYELAQRAMKVPCVHRFVRMVFQVSANGATLDRHMQCGDCGQRVDGVAGLKISRGIIDEPTDGIARLD